MRPRPALTAGALLSLALAGPSFGAWLVAGTGQLAAEAGTLASPVDGAATAVTTTGVTLSWSAPASGPRPDGYVVRRDGVVVAACDGTTATSCTDSGLSPSTRYRYTVAAALGSWRGPEGAETTVTTQTPAATDTTAPTLLHLRRAGAGATTSASSVSWTATFSEPVTGVDRTDFRLTGTPSDAAITGVSGSGATWTVTASTGTGSGTLGVELVDDDSIVDAVPLPLGGAGTGSVVAGETYAVDRTALAVTVARATGQAAITNSATIGFTVTFSKPVTDFVTGDVTLGGTAAPTTATVSGSGTTYTVAVSGMTAQGTVTLTVPAGVATDAAGGKSTASSTETVTYDTVAPRVTALTLNGNGAVEVNDAISLTYDSPLSLTSVRPGSATITLSRGNGTGSKAAFDIRADGVSLTGTGSTTQASGWVAPNGSVTYAGQLSVKEDRTVVFTITDSVPRTGVAAPADKGNVTWFTGPSVTDLAGNLATGSASANNAFLF